MNKPRAYPGECKWHGFLYLLPGLLIYLIFTFLPILQTVRISFLNWEGLAPAKNFIWIQNYLEIFADPKFWLALLHNLVFVIFYCLIPIFIGLVLASLLGRYPIKGFTFFRTILFLPQVLSMVVVGVAWRWVFNPNVGPLNVFLRAIGLGSLARPWLGDFNAALPAVGSVGTWVQYGFCMVLFLAGIQRISVEYYEAAALDGANAWQELLNITIPGLRAEMGVALITTIIAALRVFDLVFVTTRGGPGEATLVTGFLVYRSAFLQNKTGYAAAIATILTVIILAISLLVRKYQSADEWSKA
ncbi:MAG: sugar ABC transporter permease [Anaerolineaceae bacterium]|nr:sugar ABC transporter permease [Anaerolineaceae bacterium]